MAEIRIRIRADNGLKVDLKDVALNNFRLCVSPSLDMLNTADSLAGPRQSRRGSDRGALLDGDIRTRRKVRLRICLSIGSINGRDRVSLIALFRVARTCPDLFGEQSSFLKIEQIETRQVSVAVPSYH